MRPLGCIVAVGPGGLIGRAGTLPWHAPEDLRHFKAATDGHTLVVGRTTFESLPGVLPGRRFVVVTSGATIAEHPRVTTAPSLDAAIAAAREQDDAPLVAGGASIYAAALPFVTDLLWTDVDDPEIAPPVAADGDVVMPPVDWDAFELVSSTPGEDPRLTFRHLRRR